MLVEPRIFLIGYTTVDLEGLRAYLLATGQMAFMADYDEAIALGITPAEALCSFYAKLCYKSLVPGKNSNLTQTRDIAGNIKGTLASGHGSVFEHSAINFVATNVSRILTHELVRHRAGWAYSQTSGRYCRLEGIDIRHDPLLDDCTEELDYAIRAIEKSVYLMECKKGLRIPNPLNPDAPYTAYVNPPAFERPNEELKWIVNKDEKDFDKKKKITSAIRGIAPNGQENEIGFSVNLRALRHFVMMRTARGAEREIRNVAGQVYSLVKSKFPLIFCDAKEEMVDGLVEITGMVTQPY